MYASSRFVILLSAVPVCLSLCLPIDAQTPPSKSKTASILPVAVKAETLLFEKDLTALCNRVATKLGMTPTRITASGASGFPVSRIRVIAALAKMLVAPDSIEAYKTETPEGMPEDANMIPDEMMPYLSAAVSEGWLTTEPLKGRQTATWGFVRKLLSRIPTLGVTPDKSKSAPKPDRTLAKETTEEETKPVQVMDEKYSGLIIDAEGLKIERSMSPRILDEDGNVVYPDQAYIPDPDTVLDKGILDYSSSLEKSKRAGEKPLVIKATKSDFKDVYISNEDAALIRKANKRAKFIETWQVCILSGN